MTQDGIFVDLRFDAQKDLFKISHLQYAKEHCSTNMPGVIKFYGFGKFPTERTVLMFEFPAESIFIRKLQLTSFPLI